MDDAIKDKVQAVMRAGRDRQESVDFFRAALGLYYLAGLMTEEAIDFKMVDRDFNRFIFHTVGRGHSITSVLQFMSGSQVVPIVGSARFTEAFTRHCPDVPPATIPFLLELNLGVAKNISKLDIGGPLLDWIYQQKDKQKGKGAQGGDQGGG